MTARNDARDRDDEYDEEEESDIDPIEEGRSAIKQAKELCESLNIKSKMHEVIAELISETMIDPLETMIKDLKKLERDRKNLRGSRREECEGDIAELEISIVAISEHSSDLLPYLEQIAELAICSPVADPAPAPSPLASDLDALALKVAALLSTPKP